ncbi:MAG: alpha/beta fold hydrolase [Halieaceae bacterium]|nr:alpha/beta fold hydrolase [Halieaceae bacterium]
MIPSAGTRHHSEDLCLGLRATLAAMLLVVLSSALAHASAVAQPMSIEDLFARPGIFGTEPRQLRWSDDGELLVFSWARPGESRRSLWCVDHRGQGLKRISATGTGSSVGEFAWEKSGDTLLFLRDGRLWRLDLAAASESELARVGASAHELRLSPDRRYASYLRDGDLWLFDLRTRREQAVTNIGIAPLSLPPTGRYSRPEREIGPGIWGGPTYAWAPDSRHIAVHHVDRRGMREVPFPNYLADETDPNPVRRGYPGDANEARRVGIVDTKSGTLELLELDDPESHQIVGFEWSPRGELLIDVASDTNVLRRLYVWGGMSEDTTGGPEQVWESVRDSRIYTRFASSWDANGRDLLILSDHENYYGLYRLERGAQTSSELIRLDSGDHDVLGAAKLTADSVFFEATAGKPAEQQVFRVTTDASTPTQLTQHPGHHSAYPSPDGRSVALLRSDDRSPPELYLLASGAAAPVRVTHSPTPAFEDFPLAEARYLQVPATATRPALHVRLLLPKEFDETRRYPVLFGPMYSNTVRNRWGAAYTLMQQALTQRGYLVVQVDVRGSTGYGRAWREAFLNDFAGGDIEDIEDAVDYLSALPYVDRERLGIWGSSYGGTLSVYTLLKKPGLFAAAVAAASAVDPRFFGTDDVAIVRRPGDGSGIFERRAEDLVDRLQDKLLLVHGMQDQVVPFKTVAALADAFIRAGKPIEMAFVPGATHGWRREPPYDRYIFNRLIEFFDRHLKPGAGKTEEAH